jgi:hypothetical protein
MDKLLLLERDGKPMEAVTSVSIDDFDGDGKNEVSIGYFTDEVVIFKYVKDVSFLEPLTLNLTLTLVLCCLPSPNPSPSTKKSRGTP